MDTLPYRLQSNRRVSERFRIDCSAMAGPTEIQQQSIILRDISPRGVGVVSIHPFEVNKTINVIIQEPIFAEPVKKEAKVVWSQQASAHLWHSGLEFGLRNPLNFLKIR